MLSNSLELLRFLREHGKDPLITEPAIEKLDAFTQKWRDGTYPLLPKERVDVPQLVMALRSALGHNSPTVGFIGAKSLMALPLGRQREFYDLAYVGNLARMLRRCKKHQKMYGIVRSLRATGDAPDEETHDLRNLIQLSLGTRSLEPALDNTFSNSFARLVKNDFTELWYCQFGYVLLGDFAEAEKFDPLISVCRTNPTFARLQEKPFTWLFWED